MMHVTRSFVHDGIEAAYRSYYTVSRPDFYCLLNTLTSSQRQANSIQNIYISITVQKKCLPLFDLPLHR